MMRRKISLLLMLLCSFVFFSVIKAEGITYYNLPGGSEEHMALSDGVLYIKTPGSYKDSQRFYHLYAYDSTAQGGFRLVGKNCLTEEETPLVIRDAIYAITRGERTMHRLHGEEGVNLPGDILLIPDDIFPEGMYANKWDQPSHFLLSVSQGSTLVYLITEGMGDIRTFCYLDGDAGVVKAHTKVQGLFGFALLDCHTALYYERRLGEQAWVFDIYRMDLRTGEKTGVGTLPDGVWGIAYDDVLDGMLYIKDGALYRYTWDGKHTLLKEGLPREPVDQRGFVFEDRTYAAYLIGLHGQPSRLMVINLPE